MARGPAKAKNIVEFGDFQTPPGLAARATALLAQRGFAPKSIIEPTCGRGAFVVTAAASFPQAERVFGFEINPEHLRAARDATAAFGARVELQEADFFATDWANVITPERGPWLVIGNPPWVTSAELGSIASTNLPEKSNFQGRKGLDAITGKANFDISEWMLLRYLDWLEGAEGTIAVLCKTAVARKILAQAWKGRSRVEAADIYKIDALADFGAAVEACLFVLKMGHGSAHRECRVYESLDATSPAEVIGFDGHHLIADLVLFEKWKGLAGDDPKYVWRSGVKHDCSKIMELWTVESGFENGLGERVPIEDAMAFPMLKSSDVGNGRLTPRGAMVVPQKYVGQPTDYIREQFPLTWKYLTTHGELLDKRGSSIYKKNPRFAIFGVGGYTFAPWKVAISGFYKRLNFTVVGPYQERPVVFDDTVYFLSCSSEAEARFIHSLLDSDPAQEFLRSVIHWDEKRPITVAVLKRLSLRRVAEVLGRTEEYESYSGALAFALAA